MATAMSEVLKTKYVVAAPTSGLASDMMSWPRCPGTPPSARYAKPAACTVSVRTAMLKIVRYVGFRCFMRNVHWLHALPMATIIVACGPSRSSAAKSTAYDTDIVDPLLASGSDTLNADVNPETSSRPTNNHGFSNVMFGRLNARTMVAAAITQQT